VSKIRVAIVEDHRVVAQALETMLSFDENFEVIASTTSGADSVELAIQVEPDVVLMDVKLEGLNGIEATRQILMRRPGMKVLILSMYDDQETVLQAVAAGAAGYLPKNVEKDELIHAIRAVAEGKGFLHPDVTRAFLARIGALADKDASRERLTDRERQVLEELSMGKTTKQIAESLFLSEETVKSHLSHVYRKLGVGDRVEAVAVALRQGLIR
jgi:two-component system response regulator DegU